MNKREFEAIMLSTEKHESDWEKYRLSPKDWKRAAIGTFDEEVAVDWTKIMETPHFAMLRQSPSLACTMPHGRRSGRTQWMINGIIEEIRAGAPLIVVIGKDWKQLLSLQQRVMNQITQVWQVTYLRPYCFDVDGTMIEFTNMPFAEAERVFRGSIFEDHLAAGEE
jgi:hypothetical protein